MGRLFLEHLGGTKIFSCDACKAFLTNRNELVSNRFTGATGRAFLFDRVVNLEMSDVQPRMMLTGRHMTKIGWIYEFAVDDQQKYKEGRVILEKALIAESDGFEEHQTDDFSPPSCTHHTL